MTDFSQFATTGVTLEWGLKESFRAYFERLSDHSYQFADGACRLNNGQFVYEIVPEASDRNKLVFSGTVQLEAHFGALSVKIAHPVIDQNASTGEIGLSAEVDEHNGEPVRMLIATLEQSLDGAESLVFRAQLADEGQYLFMGNYFSGDELDPVSVVRPDR
ncbi:hypothetical protein A6F49_02730 [Enteractinococcus helveticum]|uniref:Htaa domain-containing protein n=2 Tax=Enteractinococcus helveticum TaxID=1837282 RepID=A0A1B7LUN0_9MICC|nr:hypothetical protein A6F49_02730 [Enteractinococcus helveticum]